MVIKDKMKKRISWFYDEKSRKETEKERKNRKNENKLIKGGELESF